VPRSPAPGHSTRAHLHEVRLDDTFDFLNTLEYENGFPVEHLPDAARAIDWFAGRGIIHSTGTAPTTGTNATSGDPALERLRALRAALREVADAVVEGRAADQAALDEVNRGLRARATIELVAAPDGVGVGHRHVDDPLDDALARIAEPLVEELASGHPERVRVCANDRCRWVFYDASRAGRRRWCDMASCGNRAKAARHRARQRAGDPGGTGRAQGDA
jgi:predicted RNA-binding Zn ribbon-like protein